MIKWYRSRILRKLIKFGYWGVALRQCSDDYLFNSEGQKSEYQIISNTEYYWFTDPILYEDNNKTWLFVEAFNLEKNRGEIGVFDIVNGNAVNFRVIIKESFHMSFPLVFDIDGKKYMIPETGENNSVILYEAIEFPDKWKIQKKLLEGDQYRDSTLFSINGEYYLYTYVRTDHSKLFHTYKCEVYKFNKSEKTLSKIQEYDDTSVNRRSAGPVICDNNKTIYVTQKCDKCYGEAIEFWDASNEPTSLKNLNPYKIVFGENINIKNVGNPLIIHTYSKSSMYEVIDYKVRK